jgi:NAD(P)-dependent dehydrogenase (short-subunit alcohol dehydrogenase family)
MNAKTILITGTSSGFGRRVVPRLLARGHVVIAAMRGDEARFRQVFAEELERWPDRLRPLSMDLEKPEDFAAARARVAGEHGGRLDVLVNNAGYGLFGTLEELAPAQLRRQLETNFTGPVLLTRELLPQLRAARGRVLFLGSVAGMVGLPAYDAYCATKFALEGLAESLRMDLAPAGVQVGLVEPGGFRTDFSSRSLVFGDFADAGDGAYGGASRKLGRALARRSPRLPDAEPVVRALVRLCERRRIPLRTVVGIDARAAVLVRRWLPDGIRVPLMHAIFRRLMMS